MSTQDTVCIAQHACVSYMAVQIVNTLIIIHSCYTCCTWHVYCKYWNMYLFF